FQLSHLRHVHRCTLGAVCKPADRRCCCGRTLYSDHEHGCRHHHTRGTHQIHGACRHVHRTRLHIRPGRRRTSGQHQPELCLLHDDSCHHRSPSVQHH